MADQIHTVPHFHWDREWYFTAEESKILLVNDMEELTELIRQGKLIIGSWYTQTDEMVVGGESIVRNLLYGKMDCEAFGPRMMIGYLPDSFGQTARLPQILNGFGITSRF